MDLSTHSTSASASFWYCRIHGLERGPLTWDMLQDLAHDGDLRPSDLVRRGDQSEWTVASQARYDDPRDEPPRPAAPVETKLTERLAAALSADALATHAPAHPFRRPAAEPISRTENGESSGSAVIAETAAPDDPELVPIPPSQPSVDEDGPILTLVDDLADATPTKLPATAVADAARNRRPANPAGVALLALGLALIGLFKLALPLGLLSLYLAWRSVADLRRRPVAGGSVPVGIGLATAAAAMVVGGIDVGASVCHIAGRW